MLIELLSSSESVKTIKSKVVPCVTKGFFVPLRSWLTIINTQQKLSIFQDKNGMDRQPDPQSKGALVFSNR